MIAPRDVAARAVSVLRRGREVLWTPDFMQWGNLLSLCRTAHDARREGRDAWVLSSGPLEKWGGTFPAIRELTLARRDVRFTDQRLMPWSTGTGTGTGASAEPGRTGQPGQVAPFRVEATYDFLRSRVLDAPVMRRARLESDPGRLVVNVRRGDYFSDPRHRLEFGLDTRAYVRTAVRTAIERGGPPDSLRVVSDDPGWCRRELAWLADLAPVDFGDPADTPAANFADVAAARRIVMTNSTFSYWAGFASNAWYGDNLADVVVPRFFARSENDGHSRGLEERWSIVEEIPGGWDSDPALW